MKILIVDADHAQGTFLRDSLTDLGYAAEFVADAVEAIAVVSRFPPEAVICGHVPPGLDALALGRKIREVVPECGVIIHTPEPTLDLALAAVREQVGGLLPRKPELPDLLPLLDRIESRAARLRAREEQHSRLVMEYARLKRALDERRGGS